MLVLVVGLAVLAGLFFGLFALLGLRGRTLWSSLLVIIGPALDAGLTAWLLAWLGLGPVLSVLTGAMVGLASSLLIPTVLWPRRALVGRLAVRSLSARPKQAALLLVALVVSSSIVSSSLVVGDSLDATVERQVDAVWTETDVVLSGRDPGTAQPILLEAGFLAEVAAEAMALTDTEGMDLFDGIRATRALATAIEGPSGRALPSVGWYAQATIEDHPDPWPPLETDSGLTYATLGLLSDATGRHEAAITEELAEELEVEIGDPLNLSWTTVEDGRVVRHRGVVHVHAVVPSDAGAAIGGLGQPALMTSMGSFEALAGEGASSLHLSARVPYEDREAWASVEDRLANVIDLSWTARMDGLVFEPASGALAVARETGLGRLEAALVDAFRDNLSTLASEASMSELVQAPIEVLELNGHRSLVLADADITDLQWSGGALWHVGMAGAGFQVAGSGTPALWYVPEGELLDAHAIVNGTGWFGHPQGLHVMRADLPSEGATRIGEDPVHALSADDVGAVVVEGNLTDLHVAHYGARDSGEGAEPVYRHPMGVNVPDPLLNMVFEAEVNGSHILHAEGLFGWQAHRVQVDATGVEVWDLEGQSPPSPRGPRNQSAAEGPECDGDTGVVDGLNSTLAWCTGGDRLIGWNLENGDVVEMRLPKAAEIDGLGRVPVLFLAASGDDGLEVSDDEVVLSGAFDLLNLTDEDEVWVAGAVPWAWGDSQRSRLNVSASSTNVNLTGVEELEQLILGVVHPDTAVRLAGASEGDRSMVVIQSSELSYDALLRAVEAWYDDMATLESSGLGLSPVRVEAAEQAEASSGVLSGMFLVFGGFTIAAGVLLAVTVVVLLAEARRKELATLRAVGLTRADARSAALMEGLMVASLAGVLGGLLGVVLGRGVALGFTSAFSAVGATTFTFAWSWSSVVAGAVWGTVIAVTTLGASAQWSSRLDVLHALRGVRTRVQEALPWPVFVAVAAAFGLSGVAAVSLIFGGLDAPFARLRWLLIGDGLIVALSLILLWIIPALRSSNGPQSEARLRLAPTRSAGVASLGLLVWSWWPESLDPIRAQTAFDEVSMLVLGLVQVLAGVIVLVTVIPRALRALAARGRSPRLVGRLALAHPVAQPLRTAVVMSMFAVTVFAVVVLGGYTSSFAAVSGDFVEESEGDFEILLSGSRSAPVEVGTDPAAWGLVPQQAERIDAVAAVSRAVVVLDDGQNDPVPYVLRGADEAFAMHGGLPLYVWDEGLGSTEEEVWTRVLLDDEWVLLDASFGLEASTDGAAVGVLPLKLGQEFDLIAPSDPGTAKTVRVAGFLAQSSLAFSPGVWANQSLVEERYDGAITRVYVSVDPSSQVLDDDPQDVDVPPGKSEGERRAAAGVSEALDEALADEGVLVTLIVDDILLVQGLVLAILAIFQAYLALGLGVGLLGIGVVTARAVRDRTHVIGLLRAIGVTRQRIGQSLAGEVAWTGGLGLLVGAVIGMMFHVRLHAALWAEQGAELSLPWGSALSVLFGGMVLVSAAVFGPIRGATRIPPAEALRSLE
ncbi:MAG: ABC transporter permease [Candidatus Thermoplasmatota archaeon]|nr:ABC transporter permease [Candidatus Thermoplasmatota archaeon]